MVVPISIWTINDTRIACVRSDYAELSAPREIKKYINLSRTRGLLVIPSNNIFVGSLSAITSFQPVIT